jgi:hypothetical protein
MFILACKLYDLPNQKAYNIRDFVNTMVEEFGLKIHEDIFVVSDNEPKMISAFREGVNRIGCSAHYISKVIQHAFELEESRCSGAQELCKGVASCRRPPSYYILYTLFFG